MTSTAFLLGVVPLVLATGAGAESRRSIGTGAFGGVLAATMCGLGFASVAFRVVASIGRNGRRVAVTKRRSSGRGGRGVSYAGLKDEGGLYE